MGKEKSGVPRNIHPLDAERGRLLLPSGSLIGLTATVAELNYVDGVTSAIQTQLNSIQALALMLGG